MQPKRVHRSGPALVASALTLAPFAPPANAQTVVPIADLCSQPLGPVGSNIEMAARPVLSSSTLYFAADNAQFGRELWYFQPGIPPVVRGPIDFAPGLVSSNPRHILLTTASEVYLVADDPVAGPQLWKGTAGGTPTTFRRLTGFFSDNPVPVAGEIDQIVISNTGQVLFVVRPPGSGPELWSVPTSGSLSARRIATFPNIEPERQLNSFFAFAGYTYFAAYSSAAGIEPWRTDGTNVFAYADLNPGPASSYPDNFVGHPDASYFSAVGPDNQRALYRAGGTTPTYIGSTRGDSTDPWLATVIRNNLALFITKGNAPGEVFLERTDGTAAGTYLLAAADPRLAIPGSPPGIVDTGNFFYFAGFDAEHGSEPWVTGGTVATTRLAVDVAPGPTGSNPDLFAALSSSVYFAATGSAGRELYSSPLGSSSATLFDIVPGQDPATQQPYSSNPRSGLAAQNFALLFAATTPEAGEEPWVVPLPGRPPQLLRDINPGLPGSPTCSSFPRAWTAVGSRAAFLAGDPDYVRASLYLTDGTPSGTVLVHDAVPQNTSPAVRPLEFAGDLFFVASDASSGTELRRFHPGLPDSQLAADFTPSLDGNGRPLSSYPAHLTPFAGRILLSAFDPQGFRRLYLSDEEGRNFLLHTDVLTTVSPLNAATLPVAGDRAYFTGSRSGQPESIYSVGPTPGSIAQVVSGGSASLGTTFPFLTALSDRILYIKRTFTGAAELGAIFPPQQTTALLRSVSAADSLVPIGSSATHFYFWTRQGTTITISRTDGTPQGTASVLTLQPGSTIPDLPTGQIGDQFFFYLATPTSGLELWTVGPGAAGARSVRDITVGPLSSISPNPLFAGMTTVGRNLLFAASDHDSGMHLYRTDGSAVGTARLENTPAGGNSNPILGVAIGSRLYLGIDNGSTGIEPAYVDFCPTDFNRSGELNADDLGDFITGFFTDPPDPRCDWNRDSAIDADDLGNYLNDYFRGC